MQLPNHVPVMTLANATLFPQALLPLHIFEPRYRQMLANALRADRVFAVAMQKPGRTRETPSEIAGAGLIRVSVDHEDGTSHLILQGLTRVRLLAPVQRRPYRIHAIEVLATPHSESVAVDALSAKVLELVRQRLELGTFPLPFPLAKCHSISKAKQGQPPSALFSVKEILKCLEHLPNAEQLADLVACALLQNPQDRQLILETLNLECRLKHLIHFLMAEIHLQQQKSPSKPAATAGPPSLPPTQTQQNPAGPAATPNHSRDVEREPPPPTSDPLFDGGNPTAAEE